MTRPARNDKRKEAASRELLSAFSEPIRRVRTSVLYQGGLALLAVFMVLLPALYAGLVGGLAYGVYSYAEHGTQLFEGSGSVRWRLFLYVAPLVVGTIAVGFLLKPFLARRVKLPEGIALDPRAEPLLFGFVHALTKTVRSPAPTRIEVDLQVNASASFRRGFASFLGSDLRLTIGLPLVAGLTLREFTGVLAHEFGHFAQGAGMRFEYVIWHVNHWFARVVYERDAWDQRLEEWAEETDFRIGIVLHTARGLIWCSRRVLWVFMMLAHAASGFMSRQMEYNADLHAIRTVGSKAVSDSFHKLPILNVASRQAFAELQESWKELRVADDLPALIGAKATRVPKDVRRAIEQSMQQEQTGWFDTHPATHDRLLHAQRQQQEGVFQRDGEASELFADFAAFCRRMTLAHYRDNVGLVLSDENLVPTEQVVRGSGEREEALAAVEKYFGGLISVLTPIRFPPGGVPDSGAGAGEETFDALAGKIRDAKRRWKASLESARGALQEAADADSARLHAARIEALRQAGLGALVEKSDSPLARRSLAELEGVRERETARYARAGAAIAPALAAGRDRLLAVLRLLEVESLRARLPDDLCASSKNAERFVRALVALDPLWDPIDEVRGRASVLDVLLRLWDDDPPLGLRRSVDAQAGAVAESIAAAGRLLDDEPYPFEHAAGKVSLRSFLFPHLENLAGNANLIVSESEAVPDRFFTLHFRLLGELVLVASRTEAALRRQRSEPATGATSSQEAPS